MLVAVPQMVCQQPRHRFWSGGNTAMEIVGTSPPPSVGGDFCFWLIIVVREEAQVLMQVILLRCYMVVSYPKSIWIDRGMAYQGPGTSGSGAGPFYVSTFRTS